MYKFKKYNVLKHTSSIKMLDDIQRAKFLLFNYKKDFTRYNYLILTLNY